MRAAWWGRLGSVPDARMHLWLMLALTFTTGVVDAIGYLGLDKVFTGNMTGNVVILGMAIVGAEDLPVVGPTLALVGFMAGAAASGRVLRRTSPGWTTSTGVLLAVVALTILGVAALLLTVGDRPEQAVAVTATTILGAGMGIQAAVARFIAVKDVTTVVITSTITGLASDSVLGSGAAREAGGGSGRRFLAVALILVGAAAGAAMLRWHLSAALVAAGLIIAAVTALGAAHAVARRHHIGTAVADLIP